MAIITDPDLLSRYDVIFGTASQQVSMYPIGDTQKGTTSIAVWVSNTSTIVANSAAWTGVVNNDIVCLMLGTEAGHYYVNNNISTSSVTLADIDNGTSSAAISSLTVNDVTFNGVGDVDGSANTITLTGHSYVTGDAVVYDTGAETAIGGLSNTTVYYIIYEDTNTVKLASSYANAKAGTEIDITSDGTGTATFHKRLIAAVFNNGASTSEQITGNPTSGDGDGAVADGVTLQCVYSYAKGEWRTDSLISDLDPEYTDDLIRHQIPLEAITSEQFEIGGGAAHDNWIWFNDYSRKKVRTAGWAEKTLGSTNDLARETGIITLGTLDTDTQVYYQQTSTTTNPANFTFLGAVNEALRIWYDANQDGSPDNNYISYLKLFARKKGKTYSQATISDIGVTTIQTIVNRFPLAHADDTAIIATDGEILGTSPWRNAAVNSSVTDAIDGDITTGGVTFTDADATFQTWDVVPGDTLQITNGNDAGYYTIASVDSETVLTIATDFEFSGWIDTTSSATYAIYTNYLVATKAGDGTVAVVTTGDIADVNTSHGTITDTGMFGSVGAGDILWITESPYEGVFRVQSANADSLVVETTDTPFGTATVDYMVLQDGMYLEYKKEALTEFAGAPTSFDFNDSNASYGNRPTITVSGTTWDASIDTGVILEITGSENSGENDGSYTVYAQETTSIVSLVPTDILIDNADDTTATITCFDGFKRTIGTGTYAFNWKVKSNGAGLDDIYQFIQHQLRQSTDIDYGGGTARGDITDLLMSYAAPTGVGLNTFFDNLDTNDINNVTLQDHSGANRTFPYTSAGTLEFNTNLTGDANAKYWLFFTNDDAGDNLGRDYGTKDAIIVEDASSPTPLEIKGSVSAQASIPFTYDYDGNVQRGSASAGQNAPVTLVAIGLETAQFVVTTGTITRATGISISAVAALERNYLNA